jgi:hypothetical protein
MRSIKFAVSLLFVLASLGLAIRAFSPPLGASVVGPTSPDDPDLPPGRQATDKEAYLAARSEWNMLRRGINPSFPFDPEARDRAIAQMGRQLQQLETERLVRRTNAPTISTTSWTPVGPAPAPVTSSEGPVAGRVISLAVHPTNPSIVFVGTASGGLYRTLNGQAANPTWTPLFDTVQLQSNGAPAIGTLAIGAIAIAPSNPDIVYIGTGEPGITFGSGLYRIDGATTASPIVAGPINPAANYGDGDVLTAFKYTAISQILVHPTQPGTIFVSTEVGNAGLVTHNASNRPPFDGEAVHGIYRSTNGTASAGSVAFTKLKVNDQFGFATGDSWITDMTLDPSDSTGNTLLAWTRSPGGADYTGVWRSTNALTGSPTTFTRTLTADSPGARGEFAINQIGAVVTVLAVTGESPAAPNPNSCTTKGRLRRSVDGGVSWPNSDATTASQGGWVRAADGFCGEQCGYDIAVAMSPGNASLIQLGGQYAHSCAFITKRSVDGVNLTDNSGGLHPDVQVIAVSPSNPSIVWSGSDGGVWRSTDAGATWTDMNGDLSTNNNPTGKINALQYVSMATHPTDREYMTGGHAG